MGAASSVSGSGGEFSALSRSGQVAVVGGVSVGVVGLLASVLAALDGRSAGLSAAMGTPKSTCRHEIRQVQLDASVSNRGTPVKRDPGTAYVRGSSRSDCREYQRVRMAEHRH